MPAITISSVNTSTEELTATAHGLLTGDRFRLRNVGGALPAATPALAGVTDYFAIRTGADTLKVSDTNAHALAGTGIVNLTGSGSGTNTVEYGLPYCIPNAVAAPGSQVKSADLNAVWAALVAIYAFLTGQVQAIWTGITLAANQHITLNGTGRYKHNAVFTLPIGMANAQGFNGATVNGAGASGITVAGGAFLDIGIPLPIGKRIVAIRAFILDSATGPTRSVITLQRNTHTGAPTALDTATSSGTAGTRQTVQVTGLTRDVATASNYFLRVTASGGAGNTFVDDIEVDFTDPNP